MKTAFVGAVEGSYRALEALFAEGLGPDLVVTLPPEVAARHSDFADLRPLAEAHGVPLHLTRNINEPATLAELSELAPDLLMVIGWSQICGAEVREVPRLGTLGFHPAPLPLLRGRAAIPWTILTDRRETAATLFWIDEGCDSGDIVMQSFFRVAPDETARSLYEKHVSALCRLLPEALRRIAADSACRSPQDHARASYCARRRPEDGRLDWSRPSTELDRLIRAVGPPYPGAFTPHGEGRIVVESARVHNGAPRYIGLPGQVQEIDAGSLLVSCGDFTCLEITGWRSEGAAPLGRHTVLGREYVG